MLRNPQKLKSAAPLILIAIVAVASVLTLGKFISFETLRENRSALLALRDGNFIAATLFYTSIYIITVTFSIPGAVWLTLAGGFLFGVIWGTLFTVIGATIGAILLFLAARKGVGINVDKYIEANDGRIARLTRGLRENQVSVLLIMRLVPALPFFVANLLPAVIGVPLSTYALTTFIGIMPGTFVYTSIGAGLGTTFDQGGTPNLGIIFAPHILVPILGLAALAALPIVIKSLRGQKGNS